MDMMQTRTEINSDNNSNCNNNHNTNNNNNDCNNIDKNNGSVFFIDRCSRNGKRSVHFWQSNKC